MVRSDLHQRTTYRAGRLVAGEYRIEFRCIHRTEPNIWSHQVRSRYCRRTKQRRKGRTRN